MKKEKYMSWESYFMSIAIISSFRSKDPKTQTGACIIDTNNKIIGVGYNGLPRGCDDNDPSFWKDDDDKDIEKSKHSYVIHAEKNAILNSITRDLTNASIYITLHPCSSCAQAIIQTGIKKVIYLHVKPHHEKENKAVQKMFNSAKVELISYKELNAKDKDIIEKIEEIKKYYT